MTVVAESAVSTRYAFGVTLGDLLLAVKAVEPGINKKPAVPVLGGVLLTGAGAGVTVSTFDHEVSARHELDGVGEGRLLLPFATLKALLVGAGKRGTKRVTDNWSVTIAPGQNGDAVIVISGAETRLSEMPLDEYPELPLSVDEPWVEVATPELLRAVSASLVSVSTDDTLPILTAVKLELDRGLLELFSTDRYRLTRATVSVKSAADWSALVKGATLKAWARVLDKAAVTRVAVAGNGEMLWLSNGRTSYTTLLIDGDYPRIASLFPTSTPDEFVLDTATLLGAVAGLAPLAVKNTPVRLALSDTVELDVMIDESGGHSCSSLKALDVTGDAATVAFNPKFLLAVLKDFKAGDMAISISQPAKPVLFSPVIDGEKVDTIKHLLMPVRLPQN